MYHTLKTKEERPVDHILKKYPKKVCALLYKDQVLSTSDLTDDEKKRILSLSNQEWEEWDLLLHQVIAIADKHTFAFDDYIIEAMPQASKRPLTKTEGNVFVSVSQCREYLINALTYAELKLILSQTTNDWERREKRIDKAASVQEENAEGMKAYIQQKKKSTFSSMEILRDRKLIEQLENLSQLVAAYTEWEPRQEKFALKYYEITKEKYSNCGRYVYDIPYNRQTLSGKLESSKYRVWQSFSKSFSSYHLDKQSKTYIQSYNDIAKFKDRNRYFLDSVYESVFSVIKKIEETAGTTPLIILINNCNAEWGKDSYDYHYRRIRSRLQEGKYTFCNIDELADLDSSIFSTVCIIDFLTTNEELFTNCNLIVSHFGSKIPNIGYHSFIKEYSEQEISEIIENEKKAHEEPSKPTPPPNLFNSADDEIRFAKQMLMRINKHPFFAYTALINLLIGNINGSSVVKPTWLDNPDKYSVELSNNHGNVSCRYSTDYGSNYTSVSFTGNTHSVDEVSTFMYGLFRKMGVWNQFKLNAEIAVSTINQNGYLSHR